MSEVWDGWTKGDMLVFKELKDRARAENKLLFTSGMQGEFWFTPDELDAANADGKFRWGAPNWALRPASALIDILEKRMFEARIKMQETEAAFAAAVAKYGR